MAKISSICSRVCSGGTPKSTENSYYGGTIPWLNTKEIDFNVIESTEKTITEAGLNNSSAKWVEAPSVIVAMYGATAGKVAISNIRLTTNQACCNLNIDSEKADHRFVYYALKNDYIRLSSMANGGAQQNLNAQQIKDFEIPDFDLSEQKRIAAILSSLDEKIETNRKINARLEELAQALFKSWFIDFEPFGGKMPEEWEELALSDIGDIIGGATPSKDNPSYYTYAGNGIAWLTPKDLSETKAKFTGRGSEDITSLGYRKCSAKIMPAGSILFSSRAPIGYVSITLNEICTNQGFKSFVPKKVGTAFAYYLLKSLTPEIENKSTGSTFKEASGSLMKSLRVILPDKDILCKFEEVCSPVFNLQRDYEKESSRLAALRDALLPKLMSGELIPE